MTHTDTDRSARPHAARDYARARVVALAGRFGARARPGVLAAFDLGARHAQRELWAWGRFTPWEFTGDPVVVAYAWGVWLVLPTSTPVTAPAPGT